MIFEQKVRTHLPIHFGFAALERPWRGRWEGEGGVREGGGRIGRGGWEGARRRRREGGREKDKK